MKKIGYFEHSYASPLAQHMQQKLQAPFEILKESNDILKPDLNLVFVPESSSAWLLNQLQKNSSEVQILGTCDTLVRNHEGSWPHNVTSEILRSHLMQRAPKLNNRSQAYVTGEGARSQTVVGVLIQMGFAKINWVSEDPDRLQKSCDEMKRKFFNVVLEPMRNSELTLQPNNGSILVNTVESKSNPVFMQDLCYLNFIQKGGVVVDLDLTNGFTTLLEEARHVNHQVIQGSEVLWSVGRKLLQFLELQPELLGSLEEFTETLPKFEAQPNAGSVEN